MGRTRKEHNITSVFLNQAQAGKYLGHSHEWLRQNAQRHDLYKPSSGGSRPGSSNKYHRDHLELIVLHMLDPDALPEDDTLRAWQSKRVNALQAAYDEIDIWDIAL